VTVTTCASKEDEERAEIVVLDNGPGVDPAILPRIFQPFVTTKSRRGAGLGLAVAHGIVHAHGGDIRIDSRSGHGAEVTISVPMDVAPTPSPESTKVLVVDDDPDFLEQERIMLEAMGFAVVTAERSDEALEVSAREIPDAFVLDLMMERADSGARLARQLRRDPRFRRAPIVILTSVVNETGFEFSRNPREVLEWMKADAWFDKPAPIAELANALRRHLDGARKDAEESDAGDK
jgi:CheY-like chemotaxis protein